jgi:hypothetical protein
MATLSWASSVLAPKWGVAVTWCENEQRERNGEMALSTYFRMIDESIVRDVLGRFLFKYIKASSAYLSAIQCIHEIG